MILSLFIILLFIIDRADEAGRAGRERRYLDAVLRASAEFDGPPALILAVIRTESDFDETAVSSRGAVGLMQLLPDTFRYLAEDRLGEHQADTAIYEPETNIRYGSYYLSLLLDRFGDLRTALAAYNAGEGRVRAWLSDPRLSPDRTLKHIPYPETERYVQTVERRAAEYREKYNFRS